MNSFYVLLAFSGFAVLGYLSLVRLLYKHEIAGKRSAFSAGRGRLCSASALASLARSALFISLPSIGFLLFWGWAPALLWLVVAHLLIDTPANFIAVKMFRDVDVTSHFTDYGSVLGLLRAVILQGILVMVAALILTLMANFIDQQTGLFFSLAGALISVHLVRSATGRFDALIKLVVAIGLLSLSLTLAKTMGVAVFGNFSLLPEQAPWLRFDNRSLLVMLLLAGTVPLSKTGSLQRGLMTVVGTLLLVLLGFLLFQIVWQQPLLDAPALLDATSLKGDDHDQTLPLFVSIFLFLPPTMLLLLMRLNDHDAQTNANLEKPEDSELIEQQKLSLVSLVLGLSILLWLATASGIGAWNTHFTHWPNEVTTQAHFALVMRTFTTIISAYDLADGVLGRLLEMGICLLGITCLLYFINAARHQAKQAQSTNQEMPSLPVRSIGSNSGLYLAICAASMWLLFNGMNVYFWVWLMSLCWLLSSDVLLEYASYLEGATLADNIRRVFSLSLFLLGGLQLLWSGGLAMLDGRNGFAFASLFTLLMAMVLCGKSAAKCVRGVQSKPDTKLFEG